MRDMYNNRRTYSSDRHNDRMPSPQKPINRDISMDEPDIRLATAYIPNQPYVGLVPLQEGFYRGSMFPNLYRPYRDWRRN